MKMVSQAKFKIIGGDPIREILETLFKYKQVDIIAGAICIDHVYLSVAIPQKSSEFVERNAENQFDVWGEVLDNYKNRKIS